MRKEARQFSYINLFDQLRESAWWSTLMFRILASGTQSTLTHSPLLSRERTPRRPSKVNAIDSPMAMT